MISKINKTKEELRKYALEKRLDIVPKLPGISNLAVFKIINSRFFKKAKNIALFYPIKNEINLLSLLQLDDKNFYFPKCTDDNNLEFLKYENINKTDFALNFVQDKYNIPIPKGDKINPCELDIIFTPALMANLKKYRLGYGKGYYDNFFKKHEIKAKKVIIIAKEFISDEFVEDKFDVKCDLIISA